MFAVSAPRTVASQSVSTLLSVTPPPRSYAGFNMVVVAASNEDATALNLRARLDRVAAGEVARTWVEWHDGSTAGVGDWDTTRRNLSERPTSTSSSITTVNTRLRQERRPLAHRDSRRRRSVTVRHLVQCGRARLPRSYVERDVELAYAATAHRVQGETVDTAHRTRAGTGRAHRGSQQYHQRPGRKHHFQTRGRATA